MSTECGPEDEQWIEALQRLRNHFFDRDIEPMRPILKAHCLRLTRDPSRAEDLMQEALARSLSSCQICGCPSNLRAYVLRTATNLWIDQLRTHERAKLIERVLSITQPTTTHEPAEPLFELVASELPKREFEALMLTAVLGYSGEEAADLLQTSAAAIKMARSRGRKRLRNLEQQSGLLR